MKENVPRTGVQVTGTCPLVPPTSAASTATLSLMKLHAWCAGSTHRPRIPDGGTQPAEFSFC
jgi:hypothetical protein